MTPETTLRVVKEIAVPRPVEDAFRVFTERFDAWWPKSTHSVSRERCASANLEPSPGGRVYERDVDGREHEWGRIVVFEPPHRLVFSWHPGYDPAQVGEVTVTFVPVGELTLVTLAHAGFERRGADAAAIRDNYDKGWGYVLGECFVALAGT